MDGERLSELRKDRGMSQADLAHYLNLSQNAVSLHERNETEPDDATKIKLASLFNVSLDYLMGVSREQNPPRVKSCILMLRDVPEQAAEELDTYVAYLRTKYHF